MLRLLRGHWAGFGRANSGIASVEFVIILPLMAIMLFGTIEIGRLLFDYHAASKSVRDATRYLTRQDATAMGMTCAGVNNAAAPVMEAKNLALRGSIDAAMPYLLTYWTNPTTIAVSAGCVANSADPKPYQGFYGNVDQIPSITVTANITFPLMNGWVIGQGANLTFTIRHEEAHFGQ